MDNGEIYEESDSDIDIEQLDDLIEVLLNMPPKYLPLSEDLACTGCKSILKKEIGRPEEDVIKVKCQSCSAEYFIDFRR